MCEKTSPLGTLSSDIFSLTVGGCPPFRVKSFFGGNNFITFPSRLIRRVVLPMEYLVILVLLLIVATGYIEAVKK